MNKLFTPLKLRHVEFRNRIFVSPMAQYSAQDGLPNDWHFVHLGSRAVGGAALIIGEAAAVSPEGRITPWDCGIWSHEHVEPWARIARFVKEQGAIPGMQLAHAGRKASADVPWRGGRPLLPREGGWEPLGPSPVPFDTGFVAPRPLSTSEVPQVVTQFVAATRRCAQAGFRVLELHMAHGYLIHEFLSPITNRREDQYGGSFENRTRFALEIARAVREAWPDHLPLFVRISCTDWVEGGWDLAQSIDLIRRMKEMGVDLIDCSSGGLVPDAVIPAGPGFQTPFAAAIRQEAGIATAAVGLITQPVQAEQIVATGHADAVLLGRELLRNPYWPLQAAQALGADVPWPNQYLRAKA